VPAWECRSSPPWPPGAGSRGSWPRCAPETSRRTTQGPIEGSGVAVGPGQSRRSRGLELARHGRSPAAAARRPPRRWLVITPRSAASTRRRRRGPPRLPAGSTISTAARPHGQIGLQPGMQRVTGSTVSTAAWSLTKPVALAAAAPAGMHGRALGSGAELRSLGRRRAAPQPRSPATPQPLHRAAQDAGSTASHIRLQPPSPVVAGVSPVLPPNIARPAAAGAGANDWGSGSGSSSGRGSGGGSSSGSGSGGGDSGSGGGVALPSPARTAAQVQQQRLEQMRNSHRRQVKRRRIGSATAALPDTPCCAAPPTRRLLRRAGCSPFSSKPEAQSLPCRGLPHRAGLWTD